MCVCGGGVVGLKGRLDENAGEVYIMQRDMLMLNYAITEYKCNNYCWELLSQGSARHQVSTVKWSATLLSLNF